jgi:hypothetical protein
MAQALSTGSLLVVLLYLLAWTVCVSLYRRDRTWHPLVDGVLLLIGSVGAYFLSLQAGESVHFFIGHGLAVIQLGRLLRGLSLREKKISLLIACFHVAVGCTVVLDMRFLFILGGALISLPRALAEFTHEEFDLQEASAAAVRRPRIGHYALIAVMMVGFFLVFPRGLRSGPFRAQGIKGDDIGTLLDSMLDPSRSATLQSRKVILQVQGEKLGYLRCMALTDFDGVHWKGMPLSAARALPAPAPTLQAGALERRVRVKDAQFLGSVLPADGEVLGIEGKFFRDASVDLHGVVI